MATPSEWSKLSRDEQEAVDALSWQIVWRCRQKRHPALEGEDCIFLTVRHVQRLVAAVDAALHDQKNLLAAFLVLPNTRAASSREPEYLQIVPVGDLERKPREIPATRGLWAGRRAERLGRVPSSG
jgi:hypothetical protein